VSNFDYVELEGYADLEGSIEIDPNEKIIQGRLLIAQPYHTIYGQVGLKIRYRTWRLR